ncbi:hypothetical protein [Streptomyces sp. BK79]|uniref:hypothetical protein n=1 Tax=Streptomyces sp. BK79 TaxID=3350097 RepID=UPI00376F7F0C
MSRSSKKSEPAFAELNGTYWVDDCALPCTLCTALHRSHPAQPHTPTAAGGAGRHLARIRDVILTVATLTVTAALVFSLTP